MNKQSIVTICFTLLIILSVGFYWFQYRPSQIKSRCTAEAEFDTNILSISDAQARYKAIDDYYKLCLHRFGL